MPMSTPVRRLTRPSTPTKPRTQNRQRAGPLGRPFPKLRTTRAVPQVAQPVAPAAPAPPPPSPVTPATSPLALPSPTSAPLAKTQPPSATDFFDFGGGIQAGIGADGRFTARGGIGGDINAFVTTEELIQSLDPDQQTELVNAAESGLFSDPEVNPRGISLQDLVDMFGPEVLYATRGQLASIIGDLNMYQKDEAGEVRTDDEGNPLFVVDDFNDRVDVENSIRTDIIQPIIEQLELDERVQQGVETYMGFAEEASGIREELNEWFDRREQELREDFGDALITDDELAGMIRSANNLIQREFGQFSTAAGADLASRGFGTGTFSASLDAMNRNRALEAQLGASNELRIRQYEVNADNLARFNQILNQVGDQRRASELFFLDTGKRLADAIASLQAGEPIVPIDLSGVSEFVESIMDDANADILLNEQMNPGILDTIVESFTGGLGNVIATATVGQIPNWFS